MNGVAADKLLERMRATKTGWGQKDFERLLKGFGFKVVGKKHDIYIHTIYSDLRIGVPRHNKLKKWVAQDAVKVVDELKRRLKELEEKGK